MSETLFYLTAVVMGLVVVVLFRGLWNMMKNGDGNFSNKMMRLRIALQALAIVLVLAGLWYSGQSV